MILREKVREIQMQMEIVKEKLREIRMVKLKERLKEKLKHLEIERG